MYYILWKWFWKGPSFSLQNGALYAAKPHVHVRNNLWYCNSIISLSIYKSRESHELSSPLQAEKKFLPFNKCGACACRQLRVQILAHAHFCVHFRRFLHPFVRSMLFKRMRDFPLLLTLSNLYAQWSVYLTCLTFSMRMLTFFCRIFYGLIFTVCIMVFTQFVTYFIAVFMTCHQKNTLFLPIEAFFSLLRVVK